MYVTAIAVMGFLTWAGASWALAGSRQPLHHGHWQDQNLCVSFIHAQINVVTYISDILVDVMYYFCGILGTSLEKKAAALTSAICYS